MTEPVDTIQIITKAIDDTKPEVDELIQAFDIINKKYRYLSGFLMNKILELDSIFSSGDDNIRSLRKEQIDKIQEILSRLDCSKLS